MTPYQLEQCQILRRIAERGRELALNGERAGNRYIDLFQHMLDEVERLTQSDATCESQK